MNDIANKEDIKLVIDRFYSKVQVDSIIGPIFQSSIKKEEWPAHLERMYGFWNTVLFGKIEYRGNPFSKHADLPLDKHHFDRWISLLSETVDSKFKGSKADEVKSRAIKMGAMFQMKLVRIKSQKSYINIM